MKINNFALIIGAMKCGTTSLFRYLSEHPEISPCTNKEYNFFARSENFNKGFEFYQNLWVWNHDTYKIALQAPTNHTRITHPYHTNAAENIVKFQTFTNTKFKFIYIMRNPIDRIESHYNHILAGAEQTQKNISKEVIKEVLDTSRYAMQLDEYYKRFPSESILLLNFDEFKNNTLDVLYKVCRFLEIDSEYKFQRTKKIYNKKEQRKNWLPGYYLIKKNILLNKIIRQVPGNIREETIEIIFNLFGAIIQKEYLKLSPEQRNHILRELREDLIKLRDKYGFNVSSWNLNI